MSYYLFVDSTTCSAYFRSNFERYSVLGICWWNPKQRRRSEKNSKFADSATNLVWNLATNSVAEFAYNAQNAQFGLVMKQLFLHKNCKIFSYSAAVLQALSHPRCLNQDLIFDQHLHVQFSIKFK